MTKAADALGIHPAAVRAWLDLGDQLDALEDAGRLTPCQADPHPFAPDASRTDRMEAAEACTYCPALTPCDLFATANRERFGVWGGQDRGHRTTRKKQAA